MKFQPGDVIAINFPGVQGIKRRPAVVLSSELYHISRPDIIVGLITSQTAAAISPTDCLLLDWADAGLKRPSAFRSFIATLPPESNPVLIGHLSGRDWESVCQCARLAMDF